jgi:hypothetical protein
MNGKLAANLTRGYTSEDIAFIESTRPEGGGWRLFEYVKEFSKVTWARMNDEQQMTLRTVQPVDDLLEETHAARAESAGKKWGDGMQKVASIPIHIWQRELAEAQREGDERHVHRWLNDPDHAKFRTKEGKV